MSLQAQRQQLADTMPYLKGAGLTDHEGAKQGGTAAALQPNLDPANINRPPTPEGIAKYRKSYQHQPGLRFYHAGLVDQPLPPTHTRYGVANSRGDKVGDTFEQVPKSELMDFYNTQKEAVYDSNVREPLGTSYSRGHVLPAQTQTEDFRFGKGSLASETAKNLIYFEDPVPDRRVQPRPPERDPLYHRERDLTKQVDRNYNWDSAGINPEAFRFGKMHDAEVDGVRNALQPNTELNTRVGSKRVHEIRNYSHDRLGQQRELRGTLRQLGSDFVFGRPNTPDEWSAKKCVGGNFSRQEQMPDKDLGVSIRKLNPLQKAPFGSEHVYGTPTIRSDKPEPRQRSIADPQNYGNEHNAKGLLYPSKYAYDGVHEEEFLVARDAAEIREIFLKMGYNFTDEKFGRLCDVAVRDFGALSVDSFRHAVNRYGNSPQMSTKMRTTPMVAGTEGGASGRLATPDRGNLSARMLSPLHGAGAQPQAGF